MRCEDLSDRMPMSAAGAGLTEAESTHLAGCPSCAHEWRIVRASQLLGQSGAEVDSTRVVAAVLTGLKGAPAPGLLRRPRSSRRRWVAIGLAAAAVLALAIGFSRGWGAGDEVGAAAVPELLLTELDGLTSAELEEIVAQLEVNDVGSLVDPGTADLTTEELERLLRSWEG